MIRKVPSRSERKAETRGAILRAATKLFARDGVHATSIDRIASEVGVTSGAIYASFASKHALVMEIFDQQPVKLEVSLLYREDLTLDERLVLVGKNFFGRMQGAKLEDVLLDFEYLLYTLRDRKLRRAEAAEYSALHQAVGERLEEVARVRGERLPLPGASMSALLLSISHGIAQEMFREPSALTEESVVAAFRMLATQAERHPARG